MHFNPRSVNDLDLEIKYWKQLMGGHMQLLPPQKGFIIWVFCDRKMAVTGCILSGKRVIQCFVVQWIIIVCVSANLAFISVGKLSWKEIAIGC
jgi:hypothetical protein